MPVIVLREYIEASNREAEQLEHALREQLKEAYGPEGEKILEELLAAFMKEGPDSRKVNAPRPPGME